MTIDVFADLSQKNSNSQYLFMNVELQLVGGKKKHSKKISHACLTCNIFSRKREGRRQLIYGFD